MLLVAACSDSSGERADAVAGVNEAQRGGGGWGTLAIQADWVERYDTLAEMGMKADVVVIAQATGVDGVRRVGGEGLEGINLAQVRFEVIRAISDWDADSVVVEFDEPNSLKALEEVAGFPPAVLILREKGTKEEAGLYRLVNDQALWTEQPDGGVFPPLYGSPSVERYASELGEIKGLEGLGGHLEAARRRCDPECGRGPRPEGG
ncbi:MAG TPA: hypothetical protein VK507_08590 [Iamia sp.]|nr:hypothetical protein [Iamia sp.]